MSKKSNNNDACNLSENTNTSKAIKHNRFYDEHNDNDYHQSRNKSFNENSANNRSCN